MSLKKIDTSSLTSIMEGFDISTQPATNAGAPFTSGSDNPPNTIQNNNLYNEILNSPNGSSVDIGIPSELSEEFLKLTRTQEENLNEVLREYTTTEEEVNFSKMITNLLKF